MIKVFPDIPKKFTLLVSGGVDSVVACVWLKKVYRKEFEVLHFNHNIQESNRFMESSVLSLCKDLNINISVIFKPKGGDVSENSLRAWRLSNLKSIGGNFITAHHMGDVKENYLSNCIKGHGGHVPIAKHTDLNSYTKVYHPFLLTNKDDFVEYAKNEKLRRYIVEDPTNTSMCHTRNWIRKMIGEMEDRGLGMEKMIRRNFYKN